MECQKQICQGLQKSHQRMQIEINKRLNEPTQKAKRDAQAKDAEELKRIRSKPTEAADRAKHNIKATLPVYEIDFSNQDVASQFRAITVKKT